MMTVRRLGIVAALMALAIDQGSKWWLLRIYDLPDRQPVRLAPVLDLVLAWNRGVSYSLFWAEGDLGRWLLVGVTMLATGLLGVWLCRATSCLSGLAIGLLIGGALGNVIDRAIYGAVVDFVYFHVGSFRWYIFNGADCAIVIGVAMLLADLAWLRPAAHAPKSP